MDVSRLSLTNYAIARLQLSVFANNYVQMLTTHTDARFDLKLTVPAKTLADSYMLQMPAN